MAIYLAMTPARLSITFVFDIEIPGLDWHVMSLPAGKHQWETP